MRSSNLRHYDDITNKIIRAAQVVHHRLGPDCQEQQYQQMLSSEVAVQGFLVAAEQALPMVVDGRTRAWLHADLVVNDTVIVECKAASRWLGDGELAQLLTYLAVSGLPVGLLLNFGQRRLEYRRVFPPHRPEEWVRHVAPWMRRR